jgi:hypothetical protein
VKELFELNTENYSSNIFGILMYAEEIAYLSW